MALMAQSTSIVEDIEPFEGRGTPLIVLVEGNA